MTLSLPIIHILDLLDLYVLFMRFQRLFYVVGYTFVAQGGQAQSMSALWVAATVFVLVASLCVRVLVIARCPRTSTPNWLLPVLFGLMLLVAGIVLLAAHDAG